MKTTKQLCLYVNKNKLEKWKIIAKEMDYSLKELILFAMESYIEKHPKLIQALPKLEEIQEIEQEKQQETDVDVELEKKLKQIEKKIKIKK